MRQTGLFTRLAHATSRAAGRPATFATAVAIIVAWAATGPMFHFSDTWQLVINTGTTVITFLMVFLIQNTQNRDSAAIQIKLDELIRATEGAHYRLLDLEELEEEELDELRSRYQELAAIARKRLAEGKSDTDTPEIREEAKRSRRRGKPDKTAGAGTGEAGR